MNHVDQTWKMIGQAMDCVACPEWKACKAEKGSELCIDNLKISMVKAVVLDRCEERSAS